MSRGVYLVESVSQHAHGLVAVGQRLPVGINIDAVGQTADDEHLGTLLTEVGNEAPYEVLPVDGAVAGADDVDDTALVEVGRPHIIEDDGRINALLHALWVCVVAKAEGLYVMFLDEGHLASGMLQGRVPVAEGCHKAVGALWKYVLDVVAVFIDGSSTAQLLVELQGRLEIEAHETGEGDGIVCLLLVHNLSMYLAKAAL